MAYTLIGSPRSPFARICRMLMLQHGLDFEFKALNFLEDKHDAEELSRISPINKVPILLDGGQKIFDSRVIVAYLAQKHGWPRLTPDEENLVTAIYSCMDVSVILFLMKRDGFDMNGPGIFLPRQRERIPRNLEFVTPWARAADPARDWKYPAMSLYSYLFWAAKREILDLAKYPEMRAFMDKFSSAPGLEQTGFV